MPTKVAVHRVILGRDHPTKKDKHGKPVQHNVHVQPGQSFDFSEDDLKDLGPDAVRDPVNEGQESEEDARVREAVEASRKDRTFPAAPGDAANVARTAARGQGARRQAANPHKDEEPETGSEEEDAL